MRGFKRLLRSRRKTENEERRTKNERPVWESAPFPALNRLTTKEKNVILIPKENKHVFGAIKL